jgi:N6-adenosine-specific RNA methylase IME4
LTLAFHRYANLFPLIEGQEFFELAEDIRANGLYDRIDLIEVDGAYQILDGRNRYRALAWLVSTGEALGDTWGYKSGLSLTAEDLSDYDNLFLYVIGDENDTDSDLLDFVLSKNLKRRHLDESQRAMVAARIANLAHGGNRRSDQPANLPLETVPVSQARAAELLNVSERTVRDAKTVQREASPELVEAVDRGALAVSAAAEIAAQPAARQAEIIKNLPRDAAGKLTPDVKKALGPVIKEIRAEKVAAKKEKRAAREETLGRKLQTLPTKTFGVAIEDFEWDHEVWSRETGTERHPSMHYETAEQAHTPEEIVARCAERFACLADTCIVFKWTTIPHMPIALKVLELQGFECVTHLMWEKERPGNARGSGYWFTGEHEVVLVGTRGKVVPPATAHFRSRFLAPVGEHSEKPPNIHEIIEFHWPNTPKVEFNARRARPGWTAWGFDAPEIADDGEGSRAVDCPAPAADSVSCGSGIVDSNVGGPPSAVIETAVPPADRPGCNLQPPQTGAHPLDIPEFLRRPIKQAEMDLTRRDHAPPEIVDAAMQTRLPLTEDELRLHAALTSVAAGQDVEGAVVRDLVGADFVHATTGRLIVTEAGRTFLAQLVPAAQSGGIAA